MQKLGRGLANKQDGRLIPKLPLIAPSNPEIRHYPSNRRQIITATSPRRVAEPSGDFDAGKRRMQSRNLQRRKGRPESRGLDFGSTRNRRRDETSPAVTPPPQNRRREEVNAPAWMVRQGAIRKSKGPSK